MKKYLILIFILLGSPIICFSQFFATGGYQNGGHGSGGGLPVAIIDESLVNHQDQVKINPNPFHSETRLFLNLASPSRVGVKIFDLNGKLVKALSEIENLPAGQHRFDWNGNNDKGIKVSAGIYIYQVILDTRVMNYKVIYLE